MTGLIQKLGSNPNFTKCDFLENYGLYIYIYLDDCFVFNQKIKEKEMILLTSLTLT